VPVLYYVLCHLYACLMFLARWGSGARLVKLIAACWIIVVRFLAGFFSSQPRPPSCPEGTVSFCFGRKVSGARSCSPPSGVEVKYSCDCVPYGVVIRRRSL
jgi:hypothetical protein